MAKSPTLPVPAMPTAAKSKSRTILQRHIEARAKLWPDISSERLWDRKKREGFATVPRLMPLLMAIMDSLSEKGFPVSSTYFEMWCRLFDEQYLTLNRPEEMAFHAGFTGQRALRTWKDRVKRLHDLEFINVKEGPMGPLSYAIFFNPYHVVAKYRSNGKISDARWQALVVRANEVGAFDLDDVDEHGNYIEKSS
jgi:hypothetical protein